MKSNKNISKIKCSFYGCNNKIDGRKNHIIPKFMLKDSYIFDEKGRTIQINEGELFKNKQDGFKPKLFCYNCEYNFSIYDDFASKFIKKYFYSGNPLVGYYLDKKFYTYYLIFNNINDGKKLFRFILSLFIRIHCLNGNLFSKKQFKTITKSYENEDMECSNCSIFIYSTPSFSNGLIYIDEITYCREQFEIVWNSKSLNKTLRFSIFVPEHNKSEKLFKNCFDNKKLLIADLPYNYYYQNEKQGFLQIMLKNIKGRK